MSDAQVNQVANQLLPTTLVGSYPQPEWLIDKNKLITSSPPRVRMKEVWRHSGEELIAAQDDAVQLTVRDMERAGIDILTDGEMRRESYFNEFANALGGLDLDNPGEVLSRLGNPTLVPKVIGPIERAAPVLVRDVEYLRSQTERPIKVTVPGPFTMTRLVVDDYYHDEEALTTAYAEAVNAELKDLEAAGADVIQLDEPYLQSNAEEAKSNGVSAINRALEGIKSTKAIHLCFGYAYVVKEKPSGYSFLAELEDSHADQISVEAAEPGLDPTIFESLPSKTIILGALNMADETREMPEIVADRIRAALEHVTPDRLVIAPDCGMKYLPRDVAFGKLKSLAGGAALVRAEIEGH
jgi:5-methyltetrahydropteroyltriglutamate--homocysteine methyltransferase